jgi:prolyl-tRNA synthetase
MQAGAKFRDIDLLGFPYQVVVGRRAADSIVEVVTRATGEKTDVPAEAVGRCLNELLSGSNTV